MEGGIHENIKEYFDIIKTSVGMLLYLSNDILDYAYIESGKLRLSYSSFDYMKSIKEIS